MRVINADNIATIPGQSSPDTGGYTVASLVVLETLLLVLIVGQIELVAKVRLIPRAIDQPAALGAIPDRQGACVGCVEELL